MERRMRQHAQSGERLSAWRGRPGLRDCTLRVPSLHPGYDATPTRRA